MGMLLGNTVNKHWFLLSCLINLSYWQLLKMYFLVDGFLNVYWFHSLCKIHLCTVHTVPNVTSYFRNNINVCCQFQKTHMIHMIVKGPYLRIMAETNITQKIGVLVYIWDGLKSRLSTFIMWPLAWRDVHQCGLGLTACVWWKWDIAATKSFTANQRTETLWSKCVCDVWQHCAFTKIVITWLNHRIVN